jgi:cytochrome c oxidase assembly factor CtaG
MPFALFHSGGEVPGNLLAAWSFPSGPFVALALTLTVYLRGWRAAHQTRPFDLPAWRAACFAGGIASVWIAIASPIDALDDDLLAAHMIQHFILMSVAPPLIILGAPAVPLLRGLPQWITRNIAGPLLRMRRLRAAARFITHPVTAWLLMNVAYLGWHVPAMFELTFRSESIHNFEHGCFFFTSLGFWWIVIAPWPAASRWPRWTVIPYLLTADIVNTILSATLAFSGRVLYPSYAAAERITRLSPLQDQVAAGAEMWVLNSLVMLLPAFIITLHLLTPRALRNQRRSTATSTLTR